MALPSRAARMAPVSRKMSPSELPGPVGTRGRARGGHRGKVAVEAAGGGGRPGRGYPGGAGRCPQPWCKQTSSIKTPQSILTSSSEMAGETPAGCHPGAAVTRTVTRTHSPRPSPSHSFTHNTHTRHRHAAPKPQAPPVQAHPVTRNSALTGCMHVANKTTCNLETVSA